MALQNPMTSGRLFEREEELAAIDVALARSAQGVGALVMIDGSAGVGKTALLEAARTNAEEAGLLVVRARGTELEQAFGFGVVRQLFDEVLRGGAFDPEVLFTGAARFAAPLLDVPVDGATAVPAEDPFAARHALYWLTANLAAQRPLAVLVDDGHWADSASLGVLAHIANRLEGIPAALIVASRIEESLPALDALRVQAATHGALLHVPPLGAEAAATVVRSLAPSADDALCHACHAASGGNPFLLRELARSMLEGEVSGDGVAEQSPERVTREIAARLARIPEAAGRIAAAVAVLGGGVPLRQAARLADVGEDEAIAAADVLVAKGILRGAHPLEFLHPLIGAAVYAGVGPAARSLDHARAARQLADEGESPERVAAQLLRCQPADDRWAYERLVGAAHLAAARGAADAVATYLQRALDEPAPPEHRAEILLELGAAESQFDHAAAVGHLREALASEIALDQRFAATMLLAGLLGQVARVAEAADVLEAQIDAFGERPDLRGPTEAAFLNITRIDPGTRHRGAAVLERLRRRVEEGDRDPAVLGTVAAEMGMAGDPVDRTVEVAERAVLGVSSSATTAAGWSWYNAARSLVMSERYDVASRALDDALERARSRGAVFDVGCVLTFRGELNLLVGDLANAEIDSRTLHEIAAGYGWPLGEGFAAGVLGEVLIDRGELAEAEELLTTGTFTGPAVALPHVYPYVWVILARGRLRLAQGRVEEAIEELREAGRRALGIDHVNPAAVPWRSRLAEALMQAGQSAEAGRLAADDLERARAQGSARPIGIALRASARVAGGDEEIRLLREAVAVLDPSGAAVETARAHADLGAALRRAGDLDGARDALRRAVDLSHRCGAAAVEDAAVAELRATGARPRRRATTGAEALTPSERRIAELAAGGQQNREIAEALFVTTATVEYHLRNAYRKLGIASRTELAATLAGGSASKR
jgi:DNA-binding CsgD family transcriptional regulator